MIQFISNPLCVLVPGSKIGYCKEVTIVSVEIADDPRILPLISEHPICNIQNSRVCKHQSDCIIWKFDHGKNSLLTSLKHWDLIREVQLH